MGSQRPTAETESAIKMCYRELPETFEGGTLAFGFDGVVDNVREMVETRHESTEYDRLKRLSDLETRLQNSLTAESSLTIEWETEGTRTGGHACHLSRAFNHLGANTVMIGTYGEPPQEPFVSEFDASTIVSIGEPGVCDAVEFDDGKLMLSEPGEASQLNWEMLVDRVDVEAIAKHLDGCNVLGVGYWNVTGELPELLATLVEETWPLQSSPPERVFFDPADIRQLPDKQIRRGAARLAEVSQTVPVTVSANRAETEKIAGVVDGHDTGRLRKDAEVAFDVLDVDQFIGHGRSESVGVDRTTTVDVQVPVTSSPAMTTSAGDHFNVGFLVGELADLSLPAKIVVGNTVARAFVRSGSPPSYEQIREGIELYRDEF